MSREARQDKTRSPAPNELARLYGLEMELSCRILALHQTERETKDELREVRAAIKRACRDKETVI